MTYSTLTLWESDMEYEDGDLLEVKNPEYNDSSYDEIAFSANRFGHDDNFYSIRSSDCDMWTFKNFGNPMVADIVMPGGRIKDE